MRDGDFELVTLKSGERAVRHLGHGEVMHPAGGPWLEANRLYIEQSELALRLERHESTALCIYDVGLGAATNAVAALACASALPSRQRELTIHSFEIDLAPLRLALADRQGFPFLDPFRAAAEALMADGEWHQNGLHWHLHRGEFQVERDRAPRCAELIFFDPFSPQKNPELWKKESFAALRSCCRSDGDGGLLLTYSAATPVRVALLLGGFYVGAGLSTGTKRETTVAATAESTLVAPLGARWLERWQRSSARAPFGESILSAEAERLLRAHPQFALC